MNPLQNLQGIQSLTSGVATLGAPFQWLVVAFACLTAAVALVPRLAEWRSKTLAAMTIVLLAGELILVWMHYGLYELSPVVDPITGRISGNVAVSLWVEGERLYAWALTVALLGVVMVRQRRRLLPGVMLSVAILSAVGVLSGQPFTNPLPSYLSQYVGYLQAMAMGGAPAQGAWQGMEAARRFYYDAWFMWVHPPLLYFSYAAFTLSFVATIQMIRTRRSRFEAAAYAWARLGYVALTAGMLLGFPWALEAWSGESWWWSGFVNMSIMMWLLYTAYLHARLYLRRRHMWRAVAVLAVLSFAVLMLTYVATYVVPGTHSYAARGPAAHHRSAVAATTCRGGVA